MKKKETGSGALRVILAELGATPAQARALIEAGRAARGGTDPPGVVATLAEFLHATDVLGETAHRVLGHVPEATEYHTPGEETPAAAAPPPEADVLLAR